MNKKILIPILLIITLLLGTVVYAEPDTAPTADDNITATDNVASPPQADQGTVEPEPTPVIDESSPAPHAQASILIDMKSGKILYEKKSKEKMYPASTTKIMTAILVLENASLDDTVIASAEAIAPITNKHSHMGILVGEQFTVEQLLYGMLVYSANDAANVLAVHVAGTLEAFADMMNAKAAELGAVNTHFVNPHGFHDDNHYTCAYDLSLFGKYAMGNEKFREIVKTDMYTIEPTEKYHEIRYLSNTNHLISRKRRADCYYSKATGIKTGFTDEAGSCLVASATDGDTELLSVVLKCQNSTAADGAYSFSDSKKLLEYGFDNFKYITISKPGDVVSDSGVYESKDNVRVALTPNTDIKALLSKDITPDMLEMQLDFGEKLSAPIKKGELIGTVTYKYNGEVVAAGELISANDVERDYIITVIHIILKVVTNPIFIILLVLFIYFKITNGIKRKKKRQSRRSRLTHVDDEHIYTRRKKRR